MIFNVNLLFLGSALNANIWGHFVGSFCGGGGGFTKKVVYKLVSSLFINSNTMPINQLYFDTSYLLIKQNIYSTCLFSSTWNFPASSVALITTIFRSDRCLATSFNRPMRISVANVRSWASSNIITPYASRRGSDMASRSSIPSVMYLSNVLDEVQSSNLIL